MRNITIAVADEVYTNARVWAAEHDTSLSAVVQYMLSTLRTDWRAQHFLEVREKTGKPRPIAVPPPLGLNDTPAIKTLPENTPVIPCPGEAQNRNPQLPDCERLRSANSAPLQRFTNSPPAQSAQITGK